MVDKNSLLTRNNYAIIIINCLPDEKYCIFTTNFNLSLGIIITLDYELFFFLIFLLLLEWETS